MGDYKVVLVPELNHDCGLCIFWCSSCDCEGVSDCKEPDPIDCEEKGYWTLEEIE